MKVLLIQKKIFMIIKNFKKNIFKIYISNKKLTVKTLKNNN